MVNRSSDIFMTQRVRELRSSLEIKARVNCEGGVLHHWINFLNTDSSCTNNILGSGAVMILMRCLSLVFYMSSDVGCVLLQAANTVCQHYGWGIGRVQGGWWGDVEGWWRCSWGSGGTCDC